MKGGNEENYNRIEERTGSVQLVGNNESKTCKEYFKVCVMRIQKRVLL